MEKRDTKFYNELKQLNKDISEYLNKTNEVSPYFDFTPTFQDYIRQFAELDKQYPENSNPPAVPQFNSGAIATTSSSATPIFGLFKANNESKPPALFTSAPITSTNTAITTSSAAPSPIFGLFKANNNEPKPALFSSGMPSFGTSTSVPATTLSSAAPAPAPLFSFLNNNTNNDTRAADTKEDADAGGDDDAPPPEPQLDKYDEPDVKYSAKCKLYEKSKTMDGETTLGLLGVGQLYVKRMEDPNKLQVIFRQDPDLRRVLMNEVLTPSQPVRSLPKAVNMIFPTNSGGVKNFIAKLKDETEASNLIEQLKF